MGEFFAAGFQVVPVLGLNGILNSTRHWVVGAEDCTLNELDLASSIALEATTRTTRLGSLSPSFSGAGVAPVVGRADARRRHAVGITRWLLHVALAVRHAVIGIRLSQAVGRGWPRVRRVKTVRSSVSIAEWSSSSAHWVAMEERLFCLVLV
jgi:hypothetical protein